MITPRDYQKKAVDSIFKYFKSGKRGNPLVVAPTGSGKSIMIYLFCEEVHRRWPTQKILIISHIKEILAQDYAILKENLDSRLLGLYSAGLKSKTLRNITIAGIQSIYNKPELFDQFDIILVDEAHLIPPTKNGMYPKFFKQVEKPVIGWTATPFRLGQGYLHLGDDAFFDDIVYTIPIKLLQKEGYLCQLSSKGTKKKLDATNIRKQAGDYIIKELSLAFDRDRITKDIIFELLSYRSIRKKWLLFAIDINHAENITQRLKEVGITAACVHSKMKGNRDIIIADFKEGKYQALVSVAVLTTGFDAPDVDLIGLLRPTSSPVLHVQIIGRGLRPFPGKKDCLILDFAGNLLRNGPIDAPVIKLKGKGTGEAIMKECSNCYEIVHAAVRICPVCGEEFKFRHKLKTSSSTEKVMSTEEWHSVTEVNYNYYIGSRNIPMLQVIYNCGLRRFKEYICLEHTGYARHKAHHWWKRRSNIQPPITAQEAVEKSNTLMIPQRILVEEGGKFPNIKEQEF